MLFFLGKRMKAVLFAFLLVAVSINTTFPAASDFGKYVEAGSVLAKLPLGILADYYDCQDKTGKALIFESMYLATDVLNTAMKMSDHAQDISAFEYGFLIYHVIRFYSKFKDLSKISKHDAKKEKYDSKKEDSIPQNNLYKALKYIGLVGDSFCSLGFALDSSGDGSTRSVCSRLGSCLKLISTCTDTKNNEFYFKNYLLSASIGTIGSVIFKKFYS